MLSGPIGRHYWALAALVLLVVPGVLWGQGQVVEEVVQSVGLEGNLLGDSPDRQISVYLPPPP